MKKILLITFVLILLPFSIKVMAQTEIDDVKEYWKYRTSSTGQIYWPQVVDSLEGVIDSLERIVGKAEWSKYWCGNCKGEPPARKFDSVAINDTYQVPKLSVFYLDTAWWHDYCMKGEIRFIRGRLKFSNSKNSAPFPSAIVIFKKVSP